METNETYEASTWTADEAIEHVRRQVAAYTAPAMAIPVTNDQARALLAEIEQLRAEIERVRAETVERCARICEMEATKWRATLHFGVGPDDASKICADRVRLEGAAEDTE